MTWTYLKMVNENEKWVFMFQRELVDDFNTSWQNTTNKINWKVWRKGNIHFLPGQLNKGKLFCFGSIGNLDFY